MSSLKKLLLGSEHFVWLVAIVVVVFFARWQSIGLQPDAALYAGLSAKVLKTGEAWLIAGSENRFPIFFEHPPYFFQWGAQVLERLGSSDGAARAIGGIPGAIGCLSILLWTWFRMGWMVAALEAIMLATFGHYTKYAATSMMEGPLSLGVAWVGIASYELHWRAKTGFKRPLWWIFLIAGLMISTASKGMAGLGAWGGLVLTLCAALLLSPREPFKVLFSAFFLGVSFIVCLAPLGFWAFQMWTRNGVDWIMGYFMDQVMRSATTNRAESWHVEAGDKLYYLKVILKSGWPWWWTVFLGWLGVFSVRVLKFTPLSKVYPTLVDRFRDPVYKAWSLNALCFFLAFAVPFSLVKYQLPHYLHPTYLLMAPVGAGFLAALLLHPKIRKHVLFFFESPMIRWPLVVVAGLILFSTAKGMTHTANRGQPFVAVANELEPLPLTCKVQVAKENMDSYRMEAFALWYWGGREWEQIDNPLPSQIAVPRDRVYWDPLQGTLWGRGKCQP